MKNLKNWTLIVLTFFVLTLAGAYKIQHNKLLKEKADNERLSLNQEQLIKENNTKNIQIELTKKEWTKVVKENTDSIKSLLEQLKIKPKYVIRYVERTFTDEIVVPKLIPVNLISKNTWQIADSTGCYVWKGYATLSGESLFVKRTYFLYQDTSQDILHREKKGRFIFWNTYYKDRFTLTSKSECGKETSKTINIIK